MTSQNRRILSSGHAGPKWAALSIRRAPCSINGRGRHVPAPNCHLNCLAVLPWLQDTHFFAFLAFFLAFFLTFFLAAFFAAFFFAIAVAPSVEAGCLPTTVAPDVFRTYTGTQRENLVPFLSY